MCPEVTRFYLSKKFLLVTELVVFLLYLILTRFIIYENYLQLRQGVIGKELYFYFEPKNHPTPVGLVFAGPMLLGPAVKFTEPME